MNSTFFQTNKRVQGHRILFLLVYETSWFHNERYLWSLHLICFCTGGKFSVAIYKQSMFSELHILNLDYLDNITKQHWELHRRGKRFPLLYWESAVHPG